MARPENLSETKELTLQLPLEQYEFLTLLATLGKGGRSRPEIAIHILVRELQLLEKDGYHMRRLPRPSQ